MGLIYNQDMLTEIVRDQVARQGRGAQTRLAEACDVKVQTVNKWVQGQTHPEPHRWASIEDYFGLDRGYIASRVVTGHGREDLLDQLTEAVLDLAQRVERLESQPPRGRRRVG